MWLCCPGEKQEERIARTLSILNNALVGTYLSTTFRRFGQAARKILINGRL